MKRYLIRTGANPAEIGTTDPDMVVWHSNVGGNSGNMMFAYGVMNALQTEDTELHYVQKTSFTDREIDEINEKYDAFILPLADAFRTKWKGALNGLAACIKRLRIPAIVLGIALRAEYEPDFSIGFPFDDEARDFVKAVLGTGSVLGLRGHITAEYLARLGFKDDRDFTVIGCPSLYTYGLAAKTIDFPQKPTRLACNLNGYYHVGNLNECLLNTLRAMPGYCLVQQCENEYRHMYIGRKWLPGFFYGKVFKEDMMLLRGSSLSELYGQDRVRYFLDVPSWINFMRGFDLFVGNRFHGMVVAILSGLPHIMLPFNARTRELTEYHHLTSLRPEDIRKGTSLLDYTDRLDFQSFAKHQESNFRHYVEFLDRHGLEHIFKAKSEWAYGESPFEQKLQKLTGCQIGEYSNIVQSFDSLDYISKLKRAASVNLKAVPFGIACIKEFLLGDRRFIYPVFRK